MSSTMEPTITLNGHPVFSGEPDLIYEDDRFVGKYVYHYTSWERLLDIAESGFRLSPLTSMNDPRESKDWFIPLSVSNDSLEDDDATVFNAAIGSCKEKVRIASFSLDEPYGDLANQFRRGFARPRMWAQYAENHKGVCVILDREALDRAIRAKYAAEGLMDSSRQSLVRGKPIPGSYVTSR